MLLKKCENFQNGWWMIFKENKYIWNNNNKNENKFKG